ncbi:MAG: YbaK/EbsC family protein [Deltaproteobacteria bacterium]|jgi:prolyl-tRNA editing enzyme YbaK/EbsC (Cys-tRNA(Pro) deacylase)|nr:YbaK/EbsC family protein [Deltaproteobacteria bacterium]
MSIEATKAYFGGFGMADRILEFEVSSATVELAAKALGCEPARIGKTLSFNVKGEPVLIVFAGDARVENVKFKNHFGVKAKMLSPDEAVELIGHAIGGVCPFGVKEGVKAYLDVSLQRFETVYPACGSGNSAIHLSIPELVRYSNSLGWVDVAKY